MIDTDMEARVKLDWVVREIELRFGKDVGYVTLVYDEGNVFVSSNLSADDLVKLLTTTAEHTEEHGVPNRH